MEIEPTDRAHFNTTMHDHFGEIFPREDVSAAEVMQSINTVMSRDERLSRYVS